MMKKASVFFRLTAFLFILLFIAGNYDAQDFEVTRGAIVKIPEDRDEKGNVIKKKKGEIQKFEPSGVEPIGSGRFLLVANDDDFADKGLALKIVDASNGKVIKTLSEDIAKSTRNPKWEALAKDAEGNYYVIGAHNEAELGVKLAAKSRLFRFRLSSEWETDPMKFSIDMSSVRELRVKDSLATLKIYDPNKNQVKIEGLAVRGRGCEKELFIGLREAPFEKNIPMVLSGKIPASDAASGAIIDVPMERSFKFDAGKPKDSPIHFQLSSLEYVEKLKGFLILTSTEADEKFFGNALWFVSDEAAKNDKPDDFKELSAKDIFKFNFDDPGMKAEGIAVMPSPNGQSTKVVVVYDNDDSPQPAALEFLELIQNQ